MDNHAQSPRTLLYQTAERNSSVVPSAKPGRGALIINADDWGRDKETTDRTLECLRRGTVSSVSAMVFMEDSERAASIAINQRIDSGLHLNFTTPFSGPAIPTNLAQHQRALSNYLRKSRFAQVVYHPGLARSFEYVAAAQRDEFARLYGKQPDRYDGHHHMHLCANVIFGRLLPPGIIVRRNFSFRAGEKGFCNRFYRGLIDRVLARRHCLTDFFFSLAPLQPPSRIEGMLLLSREFAVEIETHPVEPEEYRALSCRDIFCGIGRGFGVAPRFILPARQVEPHAGR